MAGLLIDILLKIVFTKFASVADATREIELGRLTLDDRSVTGESLKVVTTSAFTSPHGSLNENLNMPVPQRGSRHQSISEKLIITTIILQFKQVLLYLLVLI